jgi:hypothetical protein
MPHLLHCQLSKDPSSSGSCLLGSCAGVLLLGLQLLELLLLLLVGRVRCVVVVMPA